MLEEIKENRGQKLESIKRAGIDPYPIKTNRTHTIIQASKGFGLFAKNRKIIVLAGRIRLKREHGGSLFLNFEDGTGVFQAFFRRDRLGDKFYKLFKDFFDVGDFIEIKGVLFKTKRGEKTIEADDFKMLSKSILPLPEKWHGVQDIEERFRKRYLDLLMNKDIKNKFEIRSKIIKEIRSFFDKEGFIEVETPILQEIPGGALARPFKTHLNALNLDLYLRVAPELYLKRLIVGGFEKVYEIGRCFRNEGVDFSHNPDFTELEFYWAYHDYKDLMELFEQMFSFLLKKLFRSSRISYQGKEINFKIPWPRIEFGELLQKYCKIDIFEDSLPEIIKKAKNFQVNIDKNDGKFRILDEIYKKVCRPQIWQPTLIIHQPIELSPLAKSLPKDFKKAARFQLLAGGLELCNAYSELNDPQVQKNRFLKQEEERKRTGIESEAHRYDADFIEALEYGMPPCAGFGMGIDRLTMLLTDSHSLREIILFPTMKPR